MTITELQKWEERKIVSPLLEEGARELRSAITDHTERSVSKMKEAHALLGPRFYEWFMFYTKAYRFNLL